MNRSFGHIDLNSSNNAFFTQKSFTHDWRGRSCRLFPIGGFTCPNRKRQRANSRKWTNSWENSPGRRRTRLSTKLCRSHAPRQAYWSFGHDCETMQSRIFQPQLMVRKSGWRIRDSYSMKRFLLIWMLFLHAQLLWSWNEFMALQDHYNSSPSRTLQQKVNSTA